MWTKHEWTLTFHGDGVGEGVEPGAVVVGRHVDPHQAQLGQLVHRLLRKLVPLVPLPRVRRQLLLGELAAHLVHHMVLRGQLRVGGVVPPPSPVAAAVALRRWVALPEERCRSSVLVSGPGGRNQAAVVASDGRASGGGGGRRRGSELRSEIARSEAHDGDDDNFVWFCRAPQQCTLLCLFFVGSVA